MEISYNEKEWDIYIWFIADNQNSMIFFQLSERSIYLK